MSLSKEILDGGFNLDDMFANSYDLSNLNRTQTTMKSVQKFFGKNIKLRNVSKKTCWNRKVMHNNVK